MRSSEAVPPPRRAGGAGRKPSADIGPSPLDAAVFASLPELNAQARAHTGVGEAEAATAVASVLYFEARLLDSGRYRDWLDLLTEDAVYWVPIRPGGEDPVRENAIHLDDRRRLLDRIALIESGLLHAQRPRSRTCRIVSNLEAWRAPAGEVEARSNLVIYEHRRGRTTIYPGWQLHRLVDQGQGWRIRRKIINLIDCDEPHGNLTFIL